MPMGKGISTLRDTSISLMQSTAAFLQQKKLQRIVPTRLLLRQSYGNDYSAH